MINVKIPKEIREYKEKIFLGLTMRQILASVLALLICIPTYLFGIKYLNEDLISWIIILIAIPFGAIGFYKKNGLPFEKYFLITIKQIFVLPEKTYFKTDNFFRAMQTKADQEIKKISVKNKKLNSLELAYLMEEREKENKEIDMEQIKTELLTVRSPQPLKPKKKKEEGNKEKRKSKAELISKEVEKKRLDNPYYVPNKYEALMLNLYANECKKKRLEEIKKGAKSIKFQNDKLKKRRNARTFIPKSTQDDLPYVTDYEEGLIEAEPNKFSKCYEIVDMNYFSAKEEESDAIFEKWGSFLNYFTPDMYFSLCIDNRIISVNERDKKILTMPNGDSYDYHRNEFNKILKKQMASGNNDIQKEKYIIVTIDADSPYEALVRFKKIDKDVVKNLKKIGSYGKVLKTESRLSYLHDKMRRGKEGEFSIDFNFLKQQGLSSKDYVAPSFFDFKMKHFSIGDSFFYRCMYITNLPANLSDEFLNEITDNDFPTITTIGYQPLAQHKAKNMVRKQFLGMQTNKIEAEKKAIRANYSPETISHELKQSYKEAEELLEDMDNTSQKMFFVTIMVMVGGETLDILEHNCENLNNKVTQFTCQLQTFDNQQRDAFKATMPMGVPPTNKLFVDRSLTTENASIFIPFSSQELFQIGGHYYGLNQQSLNMILCDRTKMKVPHGFILGSSGSGKSFAAKREMLCVLLSNNKSGLLVIDPENEYTDFARVFGGAIAELSPAGDIFINPMEMDINYGLSENDNINIPLEKKKEKALKTKVDYLMTIIKCMLAGDNDKPISPQQKTFIDEAITSTYKTYLDHDFDKNYLPIFEDLQVVFDKTKRTEDEEKVADAFKYYTSGNMNLFNHKSNLDFSNRFVVFSIRDLGRELKQISLLIVLDFIWNRMMANCQLAIRTWCYVDEIHVLFKNNYSEDYLKNLYKRGRKFGLIITGITQDVEELLDSEMAKSMISNCDFVMMLNQKSENRKILAEMLDISEAQMSYVSKADEGTGLLFAEKAIVPFVDEFPQDSYLYTLMSTKFGEDNNIDIESFIKEIQDAQIKREKEEFLASQRQLSKAG